jgi:hypothetical protein
MAKSGSSLVRQIAYTLPATPSDTIELVNGPTRAVMVNVSGFVAVRYANGLSDSIFMNAGVVYPLSVTRILVTGTPNTSATGIKVGY